MLLCMRIPLQDAMRCTSYFTVQFGSIEENMRDQYVEHCISAVQSFVTDINLTLPCLLYMFRILVYPPPPCKGGIPINTEDYACLGEDQFLNDVIIDFYLK